MAELSETHLTKRGVAKLVTVLVQTMNESDPTFQARFLERLSEAYYQVRDEPEGGEPRYELELFSWTRELLTGFSIIEGQGKPYLD